jgi:hypothetical protein
MSVLERWRRARRKVPGMVRFAIGIWIVHGVLHALGLRDWVSVLSGTPVTAVPFEVAGPAGALYVVAYFGAVVVAPILVIAAAFAELVTCRLQPSTQTTEGS